MKTLTLELTDDDYADVTKVLSMKEGTLEDGVTKVEQASNGELFASVCRDWIQWNRVRHAMPEPTCPDCEGIMVSDGRTFTCIACKRVCQIGDFVPILSFVSPPMFASMQDLRKRAETRDIAELIGVALTVYGGMLDVEQKAGGAVYVLRHRGDNQTQRLHLYPHRPEKAPSEWP